MGMSKASELREMPRQDAIITAPGAYDYLRFASCKFPSLHSLWRLV